MASDNILKSEVLMVAQFSEFCYLCIAIERIGILNGALRTKWVRSHPI
jgi:hypothetical protein